jgi:mono/diheme cytochrome c family protein
VSLITPAAGGESLTFERDVRPMFKTHCFQCHGEGEKREGGLDLRLRRTAAQGGDSGAAFAPGKPEESLLIERLRSGEMPPPDVKHRPTADEIETIERWIAAGAPTARDEPESLGDEPYLTEEERNFWSFRPVQRPALPAVRDAERLRSPIDAFLLSKLESQNLAFSPEADLRTLMRRAYFDLWGLPPSPEEVEAFLNDPAPDAYERLIERLLASPHYGERWARHWLDAAGYADSEGYTEDDPERPDAWRYRDYVIRAYNADKPFDLFLCEQLAGDEMLGRAPQNLSPHEVERLTATGFLRMAPDGTAASGVDAGAARNDTIAATLEIVATSVLGLTVGCARCHDHRYDPISQADYYRFRAIFEPALDWKSWKTPSQRRISLYTDEDRRRAAEIEEEAKKIDAERLAKQEEYIRQTFERELAKLPEEARAAVNEAFDTPAKERNDEQKRLLKEYPSVNVSAGSLYLYDAKAAADLKSYADRAAQVRATRPKEEFLRALTEPAGAAPPKTVLFIRGDHEQSGQEATPSELTVLSGDNAAKIPLDDPNLPTAGRRLAYAKWLTSGRHPLVARVIVNRVWMQHFGRGLVATPGDFGMLGERPTHPELLDWLADEFVWSGWSLKRLHRLMMNSTAYRQSSRREAASEMVDSENTLYWRMNVRRLEGEALRDGVLAATAQLNVKSGGPPIPIMADRVGQFVIGIENLNAGRPGAEIPLHGEEFRRSVYVQVRRSRPLAVLETFDLPAMTPNCTARKSTTSAPQSLLLMNGEFLLEQSRRLAERLVNEIPGDSAERIRRAWRATLARTPSEDEVAAAEKFLREQQDDFAANPDLLRPAKKSEPTMSPPVAALASVCQALLSCNEFLYID